MTTQSITTLILGTAPENATPATHILAGPWCTAPASAEETGFDMPPEPLADPERLETAARQARQLVTQLAPRLRDYLNGLYGTQHDDRYWDFVLAPWLVRAVETLIDRLYRAAGILETFGGRPLSVPVLDASEFAFADTQDFIMGGILNPQWNHWLFSRLLKRDWPAAWTAEELPPVRREAAPTRRENLLKHVARNILFSLPFPRVKGFSLRQSFDLSVVLTLNRDRRDDTIPLRLLGDPSAPPLPLGFTEDEAFDLAVALLPESLRKASIPQTLGHEQARIRSRVVSVAACEDDAYRIKMALHRGRGCRMIFIQHGGEYGYVRTSVAYPLVEYCQHRFITWGWKRHGLMPGNFLPLPHPQLAALRDAHREKSPTLLLVGTEMALLPYTLKSMLRGRQQFAYREDKARFMAALPEALRKQSQYRPYFDVPSSLEDAPWLLRRFPEVTRCTGPLEPRLLGCRLLVLDHAGTTLAQALAANIPFLLYWNPETASFTPEALPLLDRQDGAFNEAALDFQNVLVLLGKLADDTSRSNGITRGGGEGSGAVEHLIELVIAGFVGSETSQSVLNNGVFHASFTELVAKLGILCDSDALVVHEHGSGGTLQLRSQCIDDCLLAFKYLGIGQCVSPPKKCPHAKRHEDTEITCISCNLGRMGIVTA